MIPEWWHELATQADQTADRFSAAWYARFRILHAERFPEADQRTRDNLRMLAESAALCELRDAGGLFGASA